METTASLAPSAAASASASSHKNRPFPGTWLVPVLVLAAASTTAAVEYGRFLDHARHLWTSTIHDRHAHYLTGLSLALDVRQGNLPQLLHDFDGTRVWPPLHGLLVAAVLTVGGPDYRLAVLPSLLAWVGTVFLGFLTARRAAPRGGTLAGLVTALLILTSAPYRAFATDVMLESLGACLSLLVLYLYMVTVQGTSAKAGRRLAAALSALFLAKYNYWLLVVLALTAAELSTRPRIYAGLFTDACRAIDWRRWCRAQLRQPLSFLLAAVLALIGWIGATGGMEFTLGKQHISLRTPGNLVTLAYALVVLRLASWWWKNRTAVLQRLDERARPLPAWHVWPVLLWFLQPRRLGYFLWYLSPAQEGEHPQYGLEHSLRFYSSCLTEDYCGGAVLTVALLVVIGAAVLSMRKLRPGGRVLLWFVLIAAVLTLHHPNRKSRFLHSWLPASWALAGVGVACLVHGKLTRRLPAARPWLAAAAVGALGAVYLPVLAEPGHAPEGGPKPDRMSVLELTDCYLPCLEESHHAAVLSNLPMKFLCQWTFLERYQHIGKLETDVKGFGTTADEDRQAFARWLETTDCDRVVFIDVPRDSCLYEYVPICDSYERLRELLAAQRVFAPVQRWRLPQSGAVVTLWRRTATD